MSTYDKNQKAEFVPMRDGVNLNTIVTLPEEGSPWPVILNRNPYPFMQADFLEQAKFWAGHGFAFVLQECRGRGQSEGEWIPFVHEIEDGLDTLNWVIEQSWSNDRIGTYGSSYSGILQWSMAEHLPPEVKTMFIAVAGIERYKQLYMNGMFRHDLFTAWAIWNAGYEPLLPQDTLYREALSVKPHIEMDQHLFGHTLPWYRDWVTEIDPDRPFWNTGFWADLKEVPCKTKIPVMIIEGWFDHNLNSSVLSYNKLPESVRSESCFLIGPWVHTEDVAGDLDYTNHELWVPKQHRAALQWFNHHLKGEPFENVDLKGKVQTYVIGEGRWKSWDGWIKNNSVARYELACTQGPIHGLTLEKPFAGTSVSYAYDPSNPVSTKGGAALMNYLSRAPDACRPASVYQDAPGTRTDVISFLSEELEAPLQISGPITTHLTVSSDAEDTSFTVCIMEQFADGTTCNIRDGITSLRFRNDRTSPYTPNEIVEIEIELWPILWTLRKGSILRVDISSSNFPAYHAHPNIAGSWALQEEMKIAKQTIYTGDIRSSWIEIPVQ
ncbi:CocE/NonD family hydrolase [Paenibacillus brasilensis]|uniref:CocE/NonD family hydrolase n=1 Tax=Paenibacillus brasilensis TaxID=128574 RepID=A0ABU0L5K0_9BACL|nr:CocE/NonD family hydrolase [Paenibacillus brasilensis]MDQ0496583.1 putative CocE/NonD family hydrolase [Paenibacillus brasilensis]